jgi:hypothetical protein
MRFRVVFVLLLAVSCGLEKVGEFPHSNPDGIWTGPSYGKDAGEGCHVAVVEHKTGDKSYLTLCKGKIPVLRVPVSDSCFVSSDPGRHRIRNGHLYTDMTDGKRTVVKRDGKEVYSCDGAEEVLDIREVGPEVHSLSERISEGGFVYRIDGVPCVERESGRLVGTFEETSDSLCFFFSQTVMTVDGKKESFYLVSDTKVRKLEMAEDVVKVWDMGLYEGKICILASVSGKVNPIFMREDTRENLYDLYGNQIIVCRFLPSETVCVYTRLLHTGQNLMTDILWFGDRKWKMYSIGNTLSAACMKEGQYAAAINPSGPSYGYIYRGGAGCFLPDDYIVSGFESMTIRDSVLYVGLSPVKGKNPVLWRDGTLDTLRLDGYITCLE